jgi:saccharopine dehydrogenase-like NADP-dependent oxidoreductase
MMFRILLLGGYGTFGARVARRLAAEPRITLTIAGRDASQAAAFARGLSGAGHAGAAIDVTHDPASLPARLQAHAPDLVINASGPFQQQDYRVAHASIAIGAHYLDLADARDYVLGFDALDASARARGVLAVAGASTVPGLSAAVIDAMRADFVRIDSIDAGISPGNRTERGASTVAAILGYVGRPLPLWRDGGWRRAYGWQDCGRHRYPAPMGWRWLATCDVPDLALFPARYGARDVRFRAGLELPLLHLGLWTLSWLSRAGLVRDWARWSGPLLRASRGLQSYGSDVGGMHVTLRGIDARGRALTRTWTLVARSGHGPEIPATAAIVIACKLARGELHARGARACVDLFTLDEFLAALCGYEFVAAFDPAP